MAVEVRTVTEGGMVLLSAPTLITLGAKKTLRRIGMDTWGAGLTYPNLRESEPRSLEEWRTRHTHTH